MMTILILTGIGIIVLMLGYILIRVRNDVPDRNELVRSKANEEQLRKEAEGLRRRAELVDELVRDKARLETELIGERKAAAEKLKLLQDAEARLKTEFENLANTILADKGRVLSDENRQRLSDLLLPLSDQLRGFRERVDKVHTESIAQSATLLTQIQQLQELSGRVSEDANNLASALKGDSKKLGNWGELVVERVFEASGLELGREYSRQVTLRDESGGRGVPDFVVHLPDDRKVVVDSKVSLADYERYVNSDSPAEQQAALAAHVEAVRKHVRDLSEKNYSELLGDRSPDFMIMCVPIESAYQLVMQADRELVYDLARMKVVVTGPTMLMMTLKLIAQLWQREKKHRNVEEIARSAGQLYDQVVLVSDAMLDAQNRLRQTDKAFDLAMNRLQAGRGNLIRRVEQIRELGVKVSKQLAPELRDRALANDMADDNEETSPADTDQIN